MATAEVEYPGPCSKQLDISTPWLLSLLSTVEESDYVHSPTLPLSFLSISQGLVLELHSVQEKKCLPWQAIYSIGLV